MSSKTLIIIVVFGLGALVLLGMSMQFVVKSSPGLQETIRFKQELARDFETRGIEEVALRTANDGGGYHLLLTGTIPEPLFFAYQMTFAIITPALIVGAFAERMKFSAMLAFMFGWFTLAATRASRQKRLRALSSAASDAIFLTATARCSRSSRAA